MSVLMNTMCLAITLHTSLASAQFGKEWLTCVTTDDCTKISGICGRNDAVNKKFTKEFSLFSAKMSAVSSCAEMSKEEKEKNEKMIASCESKECKLVEPKESSNK